MKTLQVLLILIVAVSVAFLWGCERKIVVEESGDNGNGTELASCFGCHGDENLEVRHAREQWALSKHGSGETVERNRVHSAFYEDCERCHTQEGFLAYISDSEVEPPYHFSHIGCFTCHAPHTNGNLELRTEAAVTLLDGSMYDHGEGNLCANCHQSRADVNTYVTTGPLPSRFGPHHGPQGDMLNGTNGYEFPGIDYTNSAHTTGVANGCVDCHFEGGGAFSTAGVGGHTFTMENEEVATENVGGCNVSGCHSNLETLNRTATADYDGDGSVEGVQDEIVALMDSLEILLVAAEVFEDGSPITGADITDINVAGAVFNYMFVLEDRSNGVHNAAYAAGLLQSSIDYLNQAALASR